jgi:hypothetical protein
MAASAHSVAAASGGEPGGELCHGLAHFFRRAHEPVAAVEVEDFRVAEAELSAPQRLENHDQRDDGNPESVARRVQHDVAVVNPPQALLVARALDAVSCRPDLPVVVAWIAEKPRARIVEPVGRPRRGPGACARHDADAQAHEPERRDAGPGSLAVADRDIDVVAVEARKLAGDVNAHRDAGRRAFVGREPRQEPPGGERRNGADHDRFAGCDAPRGFRRAGNRVERLCRAREQSRAGGRQRDALAAAVKERDAQVRLELPYMLAHGALGHLQLARRGRHAEPARDGLEYAQAVEGRQPAPGAKLAQNRISIRGSSARV